MKLETCFIFICTFCTVVYGENSPATRNLFKACRLNSIPQIEKSIQEGADVNAVNEQGVLPLFYAVQNNNTHAVDLLLSKGAKLDTPTQTDPGLPANTSAPVLMWALNFNKNEMVSYLISKGASVDFKSSGGVPLVCLAVRIGDISLLDTLADKGVKFGGRFYLGNKEAGSLLHLAVGRDSVPMLSYLLEKKIDLELRNQQGYSPLMSAAYQGNLEMVKLLVAQGAYLYADRGFGKTLLEEETGRLSPLIQNYLRKVDREAKEAYQAAPWAAFVIQHPLSNYLDDKQLREYLQQGGATSGTDKEKNTLLHYIAARRDQADFLKQLIDAGLDVNAVNIHGQTPLYWAVREDYVENVKALLEKGADVRLRDREGNTPLQIMANYNNGTGGTARHKEKIAITQMLLERGAEINAQNVFGVTPIMPICENNMDSRGELIKLLIDTGADLNIQSCDLQTALHYAAEMGTPKTVKMLLEAGASVTLMDVGGRTPLDIARYDREEKLALMFPYIKDACIMQAVCYGQIDTIEKLAKTSEGGVEHVHPDRNNGATPLIAAVQEENLKIVEKLIELKANVNARDTLGNTALHFAGENGNDDIVYALLQAGASPAVKNKEGKTANDLAIAKNHLRTVQIIKENSSSEPAQAAKQVKNNIVEQADDAMGKEDPNKILQRVIEQRQWFAEQLRSNSNRPLHQAVLMGKLEFVKQLLAQDKTSAGKTDGAGLLPLTYAALTGQKEMVTLLLDNGANINQLDENTAFTSVAGVQIIHSVGTKAGFATIHYLAATEDAEMVEYVLSKGADVNIRDVERQNSPLWIANQADHTAMMKVLISHGAKLDQFDVNGYTMINSAAQGGHIDTLKKLLALGADINTRDKSGMTPLLRACLWGQDDALLYLIEKGADLKATDGGGSGALHTVISEENGAETIRILLEHGADVNQKAGNGNVPLFCMERLGRYGTDIKEGHIKNFKMLIDAGADISARNNAGDSILHITVGLLSLDMTKIAVEHGADVNWKNTKGQTPLSRAMDKACMEEEHGQFAMIQYLVEQGADVNWCDSDGSLQTLLHMAADREKPQIVKILLDHGVQVNALDKSDRTPLHYAASDHNIEIIKMLLSAGALYDLKDIYGGTAIKSMRSEEEKELLRQFQGKQQ